jgi:hypothetical protein
VLLFFSFFSISLATDKDISVEKPLIQKKDEEEKEGCTVTDLEQRAVRQAILFYEEVGFWAETFTISEVLSSRIDDLSATQFELHMKYAYRPIPDNPFGRTDSGFDQRIFVFKCDPGWVLEEMKGHMSASF